MLLEPVGGVLGRLPGALHQVLVRHGVVQLGGLDAALVVIKPGEKRAYFWFLIKLQENLLPGPLAVAGLLGEGAFEHQLVCLVVQVVVKVVPQQAVDKNCLALKVIPEGCSSEPCVQSRPEERVNMLVTKTKSIFIT